MRGVSLKIITDNNGETSLFQSEADYEKVSGGEKVSYRIGNDEGELFFSKTFVEMRRRGECGMSVRFSEGKESKLTLSSAGTKGIIPVYTECCRTRKNNRGRETELCYRFLGSEIIQTFSLKIEVKFFSEEK